MLRSAAMVALGAVSLANAMPHAQQLDIDAVATIAVQTSFSMATGVAAQIVTVDQASLTASVVAQATEAPLTTAASDSAAATAVKRDASGSCSRGAAQPTGPAGLAYTPDTPAGFQAASTWSTAANAAVPPAGWTQTFQNLNGSTSMGLGYLGYTTLQSYDVNSCAAQCNSITDCHAINIYYERDPSIDPGTGDCSAATPVPSTTLIKCVFWGGLVTATTATNVGQWRNDFQVLIAGSNGYVNYAMAAPAGYAAPTFLNNASINAPNQCGSYMGVRMFQGAFDLGLCAAACSSQSAYNLAHPPSTGSPMTCQFFVTYMLYENGYPLTQQCALYSQAWGPAYATNVGQYDQQGNHYTIGMSYAVTNATNPGTSSCSASS